MNKTMVIKKREKMDFKQLGRTGYQRCGPKSRPGTLGIEIIVRI
jgi:hypothetical protein